MNPLPQYHTPEKLEQDLGNPIHGDSLMSYEKVIQIDESEQFPHQEIDWLYQWNLQDYYIPENCGGKFTSFEEFIAIVRVLSRRDQTIGIAFTTLFWSFITWMAGTQEQKDRLSEYIRNEHGAMCLGYSEKDHGADLVGGELTATKVDGGYVLNGEKWPINRATISGMSYILAKTADDNGGRCLSLFMVEKSKINSENYYNLPKILTHGIRASDMSGIGFKDCFVPDSMLIGKEGEGLEIALKGFQITRTLCSGFSHGAADTALRTTLKFALHRRVYEERVFDLPQPRKVLSDAFLDILICDCETIASCRGFHVVPEQFSVWSAVVKYFVTTQLETMINNISAVLGSRFYMREEHDSGIFQKVLRDNAIISVFDGSTVVNLHALILQFRQITKTRQRLNEKRLRAIEENLKTIFSLDLKPPTLQLDQLALFGKGADHVLQGLEIGLQKLADLQNTYEVEPAVLKELIRLGDIVLLELNNHDQTISQSNFEYGHHQSPETFELAKKYCTLHTATSCLFMWLYNRENLGEFFAKGEWLVLALNRLLYAIRSIPYNIYEEYENNLSKEMVTLYKTEKVFSIVPFQLAKN
ncbi:acyl-CoA dehydrogenase domain-containing protein [Cyanobacterium stanieri PCC 7202]|uniref:Acyl-CoA dehydrogenase domain-containing protein n=1 Tax=Cyanobacterium stanieri (strain ATCC 29140 / PCC 7202) TaxID=292563 RepID=K9YML7_CYASC|nr:acyl-CoA dehydrogenase domain-containing protein [Cyanobacterium stanieri PCC 7202]